MSAVYQLQQAMTACKPSAPCHPPEPKLDELMRDPMTRALMVADRVDDEQLQSLFAQLRETLRGPARLSV